MLMRGPFAERNCGSGIQGLLKGL